MTKLILVINPNSNAEVTKGISDELKRLRLPGGPDFEFMTMEQAPFGIETSAHINQVVPLILNTVTSRHDADAFVIACYSDPGLAQCRQVSDVPVFGIQESGILAALRQGERFGVLALSEKSVKRHLAYIKSMGVFDRLAGERPVDLDVAESGQEHAFSKLLRTALELRDKDGADCLILGCAGMAVHRAALQDKAGLPVIDPTQAATGQAIAAISDN